MRTLRSSDAGVERASGVDSQLTAPAPTRTRETLRFVRHFLEMIVAMVAGMMVLGPMWTFLWPGLAGLPDVHAIVMATNMTVGMALWMRISGYIWVNIVEMSAAMYMPFLILLMPYWVGMISGEALMTAGHILMVPLMLVAMLWRRCDYSG